MRVAHVVCTYPYGLGKLEFLIRGFSVAEKSNCKFLDCFLCFELEMETERIF